MPPLCDELDDIAPGVWDEFCIYEGDDSVPWKSKVNGQLPCLDRDWRKIVFRFLDYFATSRKFLKSFDHNRYRLQTVAYPVRRQYSEYI